MQDYGCSTKTSFSLSYWLSKSSFEENTFHIISTETIRLKYTSFLLMLLDIPSPSFAATSLYLRNNSRPFATPTSSGITSGIGPNICPFREARCPHPPFIRIRVKRAEGFCSPEDSRQH
jgi:hypothetical protein